MGRSQIVTTYEDIHELSSLMLEAVEESKPPALLAALACCMTLARLTSPAIITEAEEMAFIEDVLTFTSAYWPEVGKETIN